MLIIMNVAKKVGATNFEAYRDSMLIVNKVRMEYKVLHEDLISYYEVTSEMVKEFNNFYIRYLPRQ